MLYTLALIVLLNGQLTMVPTTLTGDAAKCEARLQFVNEIGELSVQGKIVPILAATCLNTI